MLPLKPGRSSGRGVLMLMTEPMPPVGRLARPDLYTSTPATPSAARLPKSKLREAGASQQLPRPDAGIWRPFSSTRLKSGPNPRTVTVEPSPLLRSIDTPVMRWSDSARLVSGNLPMSSAEIASTTPCDSRFTSSDARKLARMPVTTMASPSSAEAALSSWASAGCAAMAIAAAETPSIRRPKACSRKPLISDSPPVSRAFRVQDRRL